LAEPETSLSPAFQAALASVRLEGLEPPPYALELFRRVSVGEMSTEELYRALRTYFAQQPDAAKARQAAS
jgi:hypothetical protein